MKKTRITIFLDDDLVKKLRIIQARQLTNSKSSVSFSSVLNEALRKQLKK